VRYLTVSGPVRRVLSVYLIPYILVILSVAGALHPIWLRQFPTLNLYRGDLFFSGERAHRGLLEFTGQEEVPRAGLGGFQPSVDWMADAFRAMGLQVSLEQFEAFVPVDGVNTALFTNPMQLTHQLVRGTNVVAISPGSSPVTVLLLAHRDPSGRDPYGLGNNAGGNAALLELARVLSTGDHFYTYLFVSTDATELGMEGAEYLLRSHPDLSLRVAVSLDGLGLTPDHTIALYNYGTNRQPSPLWTVALAQDVLELQGLTSVGLNLQPDEAGQASGPLDLLASLINQRGLGVRSSAGGEALLNRGDPTLGVSMVALETGMARAAATAQTGSEQASAFGQVDPDALKLAGQFIEQYVRSLDLNQFDSALLSRLYVVFEGQYLPEENIATFGALIQTAFVLLALLPFFEPMVEGRKFANFFERELPWLGRIILVSALAGLVWQLPRIAFFRVFPAGVYLLLTIAIVLIGGVIIVRQRRQYLMLWRYASTVAHQRRVLVMMLLLIYLGFTSLFSPFTAGAMLFVPFLVWAAVRFSQPITYRIWLAIFALWTAIHAAFSVLVLYAMISRIPPWGMPAMATWMLCSLLWLMVLVYVFSTPPVGIVERK
jgi:hypothetical protein